MANDKIVGDPEAQVTAVLPKAADRKILMLRLARSIEIANSIAPDAWACTLYQPGFKLNVGPVEALWLLESGIVVMNLAPTPQHPSFAGNGFSPANYKTQPSPLFRFAGTVKDYVRQQAALDAGHDAFVRMACRSPSGNPVKGTRFKKTHCEGLVTYARSVT